MHVGGARSRAARADAALLVKREIEMNRTTVSLLAAAIAACGFTIAGCEKKEGPMERAGKSVDKAMDKAGQKIENAGEKVQDAAKGK